MDTTTVLTIIGMLDARIRYYDEFHSYHDYEIGCETELTSFRNHLQSYIESQVSALENSTGE